jgi:DNA-binding Lrp family transcriptional regulator
MEKAYILLSCEIGKESEVSSQLSNIDEIKNVMITYGAYDIVLEAETSNSTQMDNFITSKIRKLEKIRSTITLRVTD